MTDFSAPGFKSPRAQVVGSTPSTTNPARPQSVKPSLTQERVEVRQVDHRPINDIPATVTERRPTPQHVQGQQLGGERPQTVSDLQALYAGTYQPAPAPASSTVPPANIAPEANAEPDNSPKWLKVLFALLCVAAVALVIYLVVQLVLGIIGAIVAAVFFFSLMCLIGRTSIGYWV